ncbi:MAG: response regulator [Desulfobacterales bacterium]|nr:response regulator [Desulfobacterales bacterium]MBF0396246.1 response regulator [Desulfobacterales bacterium]
MAKDQRFTILVVDDSPINRQLLETALSKEGYRIVKAPDGPTARKLAEAETPDLILLDIMMPGEDGFEVMKKLKQNPNTSSMPVIFLTGVSEIDSKLTGFDLGAVDYITKPFHPLEVLARVRLHLKLSIATNSLIADQANKLKQISKAQSSLLVTPSQIPEANFGIYYLSLQEAGGDFYDVLSISQDIFGYFVADFSGHDIQTSFLTSSIKALLKQNCTPVYQPMESIKMINDVLTEILPPGKYLTACYARLNRKTKEMTIINAGHPPAVYVPKNGTPRLIMANGDLLGIFKDVVFDKEIISTTKGDRFYLYSDGLVESQEKKILWSDGAPQLLEICDKVRDVPILESSNQIIKLQFGGEPKREDDIVVLGIEV